VCTLPVGPETHINCMTFPLLLKLCKTFYVET
jgi:hypothetical protein